MKKLTIRIILGLQIIMLMGASNGCGSIVEIDSLCILDTRENVCWIDKPANEKLSLSEVDSFYAMDKDDLTKILDKLNECERENLLRKDSDREDFAGYEKLFGEK